MSRGGDRKMIHLPQIESKSNRLGQTSMNDFQSENYNFITNNKKKTVGFKEQKEDVYDQVNYLIMKVIQNQIIEELKKKNEELRKDIETRNQTIFSIQRNFESLSGLLKTEKQENLSLKEILKISKESNEDLIKKNQQSQTKIHELENTVNIRDNEININKQKLSSQNRQIEDLFRQIDDSKQQVIKQKEEYESQIFSLQMNSNRIKNDLLNTTNSLQTKTQEFNDLTKEKQELKQLISNKEIELELLNNQYKNQNNQLNLLQNELSEVKNLLSLNEQEYNKNIRVYQDKIKQFENNDNQSLQQELQYFKTVNQELMKKNQYNQTLIQENELNISQKDKEISLLKKEILLLNNQIKDLTQKIENNKQNLLKFKNQQENIQNSCDEKLLKVNAELEQKNEECQAIMDSLQSKQDQVDKLTNKNQELEQALTTKINSFELLTSDFQKQQRDIALLNNEVQRIQNLLNIKETQLNNNLQKYHEQAKSFEELNNYNKETLNLREQFEKQLDNLKIQLQLSNNELQNISSQKITLEEDCKSLILKSQKEDEFNKTLIQKLNQKLEQSNLLVESLKNERDLKIEEKDNLINLLMQDFNQQNENMTKLNEQISFYNTQIQQSKSKLEQSESNSVNQIKTIKNELSLKDQEIQKLLKELDAKTQAYRIFQKELADRDDQVYKGNLEIKNLQSTIQTLNQQIQTYDPASMKVKITNLEKKEKDFQNALGKIEHAQSSIITAISCCSCMEILSQTVTCVPCGHSFCKKCISTQECPECKQSQESFKNKIMDDIVAKILYSQATLKNLKQ